MAWRFGSGKSVSSAPKLNKRDKDEADPLPTVRRDFYLEHPDVTAMSAEEANEIRAEHSIRVYGDGAPNPVSSFLQASFPQYMLDTLSEAGFTSPTAIQRQGWPVAMSGRDIIALAETGSGKTLTYLLPAIVHVNAQPVLEPGDGPLALVLAPTRELALQIHEECVRFGHPCGVRTTCIYGGVPKPPQILELKKAPEIVAATPGRLADMLSHRKTELSRCGILLLSLCVSA
eukprot:2700046-Pleurochrysis_carterae.AAC.5